MPAKKRRPMLAALFLLLLLTPNLSSAQGFCGMQRPGNIYLEGRQVSQVFVPSSSGQDVRTKKNLDAIACLVEAANSRWQNFCTTYSVPALEVQRGNRTADSDIQTAWAGDLTSIDWANYFEPSNSLNFGGQDAAGDAFNWDCKSQHHLDIVTHELGHSFGLDHDFCQPTNAIRGIMDTRILPNRSYSIQTAHCAAAKRINYCNNGQCDVSAANACGDSSTGPCRFYDGFPIFMDLCRAMALPIACGHSVPPAIELCFHITAGRIGRRTTTQVLYDPATGTTYESTEVEIVDETHSYISCTPIGWPNGVGSDPGETAADDLEGEGPIFFIRSRYVGSMSGTIPVSGVLRDDLFGPGQLAFWLDGQPVQLQGVQTSLFDPYTCSEEPAGDCDAFSGWRGFLDTSGIPNGFHTLTAAGVNYRPGDPIPNIDTVSFFVDHDQGCSETTLPVVSLTSPAATAAVSGRVVVSASASDASGIEKVQFYVDGVRTRVDLSAPWTFSWDTAVFSDGAHTLGVRSVDLCGNAAWGANVPVTVVNGQPVTLTFTPTDDAWVNQDEPDRAFGIYNFLRVRTHLGGHGRFSFLKFNVTGLGGPITSAILRLRSQDQPISRFGVYRITGNSWNEATVTWNTALLTHDWFGGEQSPWAAGTWRDFDVTGALSGTGVITFGLATGQNSGLLDIWSKESGIYVPVLEVTFVPGI